MVLPEKDYNNIHEDLQSNWLESEEKFYFTGELPESRQTRKRGKGGRNNGVKKQ